MERGPIPIVPEGLSMSLPKNKYDLHKLYMDSPRTNQFQIEQQKQQQQHRW